jgi:rod shape-determining protein MreD
LGTVIGVHAFALSANVYILAANYQRVRNYTVWQQAMIICVLVTFYHLVLFWLQFSLTKVPFIFELMWPAVTSMLLWPWLFLLLRKVRRQFILV